LHQAIDINVPIGCGDVAVFPGDVVVGDDDGVMVIPKEIADEVAYECVEMTLFENFVLEKVAEGQSIIGLYPPTNEDTLKAFNIWKEGLKNNF
jgi:regulator of RNase E activity RraA